MAQMKGVQSVNLYTFKYSNFNYQYVLQDAQMDIMQFLMIIMVVNVLYVTIDVYYVLDLLANNVLHVMRVIIYKDKNVTNHVLLDLFKWQKLGHVYNVNRISLLDKINVW